MANLDGKELRESERYKPWQCKCGATLGLVAWNGKEIPQLILFRHAVDMKADAPAEVEVLGTLTGKMPVLCDVCGEGKVWWPSAQALLALLDEMGVEQLKQFVDAFLSRSKVEGKR